MLDSIDVKYFKMCISGSEIGKDTHMDVSCRCPVCGDSTKNKRSKRLHLYSKNNETRVNCFNGDCPVENRTVYTFIRDFFPNYFENYKRETFHKRIDHLKELSNNYSDNDEGDVFSSIAQNLNEENEQKDENDKNVQSSIIENNNNLMLFDLSEYFIDIDQSKRCIDYVNSRKITYDESKFGKWFYSENDMNINDVVYKTSNSLIIPLYFNDQMYGFYSRNIDNKLFATYMHENNVGFKIWNYFNIDKSKPVYIFEGIFDAIASGLDNVVALMGAKLPDERLKELEHPIFVLDNDKTGIKNSINYAKLGYGVYVQPSNIKIKDMNDLLKQKDLFNIHDLSTLIKDNILFGMSAIVRLKNKL